MLIQPKFFPTGSTNLNVKSRVLKLSFFLFIALTFHPTSAILGQTITICSQDNSSYNINSFPGAAARAKLSNLNNFGPDGLICSFNFEYVTVGNNFTEASINANGCEIWWSGFEDDGSYTASETSEILNWITNGGLVIAGCDAPTNDPLCEILGLELSGLESGGAGTSLLNVDLTDACFPNTADIPIANGGGALDGFSEATSSQYRVVARIESNSAGIAGLNGLASAIYGNGIFATSDVNMFTNDNSCCLTSGSNLTNSNDFFMGEAICVLAKAAAGEGNCIEEAIPDPTIVVPPPLLVPTMTQWTLFIFGLLLTSLALIYIKENKNELVV